MDSQPRIKALFLDIGGVLLTNGWDHNMRAQACMLFGLDCDEMDERHHLTFDTYELGKLSLDQYLDRLVFFEPRSFTRDDFKAFMFAQSSPFPEMIELVKTLKKRYGLRVAALSNEGRELTVYRIQKFELGSFIDFFISSCFVHFRKPDEDIYRLALDVSQTKPEEVYYVEDRPMFLDIARELGIHGIPHESVESTRDALALLGLTLAQ